MKRYSAVCKNWGIDTETYRSDFEWLKADPLFGTGRLTRELGIYQPGGRPVRMMRAYYDDGSFAGFYRTDTKYWFSGKVSVSSRDFWFDC